MGGKHQFADDLDGEAIDKIKKIASDKAFDATLGFMLVGIFYGAGIGIYFFEYDLMFVLKSTLIGIAVGFFIGRIAGRIVEQEHIKKYAKKKIT